MLFQSDTGSVLALVLPTRPVILRTKPWRNQVYRKQFLTKGVECELANSP